MNTTNVCSVCGMLYFGPGHICTSYSPFIVPSVPTTLPAVPCAPERMTVEAVRRIVREEIERFHKK